MKNIQPLTYMIAMGNLHSYKTYIWGKIPIKICPLSTDGAIFIDREAREIM